MSCKMHRRQFLSTVTLAASASFVSCSSTLADLASSTMKASAQRPNVILIFTDDQGYGDLSFTGNPHLKTPNTDRIFKEGVSFNDFHGAPLCTPSRSQLMSGQDALRNGGFCYQYGREMIRLDVPLIPEIFKANGYRTGLFGKWHLGENYPYRPEDRGFDEVVTFWGAHIGQTVDYWNNDYWDDTYRRNGRLEKFTGYCDDIWFDETMKFTLDCKKKSEPFFVFLPTNLPHGPCFVPQEDQEPYKDLPIMQAGFFGMIARHDKNVGRLDKFLRENDLYEETIVIWLGDNGSNGGHKIYNAGMKGKKHSYYEGGHRVACAIRWPKGNITGGRTIDGLTQNQDIGCTLIGLCGLKNTLKAEFDGIDLSESLKSHKPVPERIEVVQVSTDVVPTKWQCTVMWNRWRLVNGVELYNLESDPGQRENLATENPDIVEKLRNHYEKWWQEVEPSTRAENSLPIYIGSSHENPVWLACFDWFGREGKGSVTVQKCIRWGDQMFGFWNIHAARGGNYEIKLCRWPQEVDAGFGEGVPEYIPPKNKEINEIQNMYPEGAALAIAKVRIKIRDFDKTIPVKKTDKAAKFNFELKQGRTTLQGWFLDEENNEICGAYYAYVKYLG
jgi:arylsulfatase A-like enzyme